MINQLTILGMGLMGGSVAKAAKQFPSPPTIVGYDPDEAACKTAKQLDFIDHYETRIPAAIANADLILIAAPVGCYQQIFTELKDQLASHVIITDLGSTKASVITAAEVLGKKIAQFVPGHPIAGSEKQGVAAAVEGLFDDCVLVLTPLPQNQSKAIQMVTEFWQQLGARVKTLSPEQHDQCLAYTSHLPHVIAAAFINSLSDPAWLAYTGQGFRDFTRIASTNPPMWRDIALANREAILEQLTLFQEQLTAFHEAIDQEDAKQLTELFAQSKRTHSG